MLKIIKVTKRPMSLSQTHPRIYFWPKNESVLENLQNRRSRPYSHYRRLFPKLVKMLRLKGELKANWSQYAGCTCGCSPAFIVSSIGNPGIHYDLHVKFELVEDEKSKK